MPCFKFCFWSKKVRIMPMDCLKSSKDRVRCFFLPAYSPELNPDELVNADLKLGIGRREPALDKVEQECQMREHMEANRNSPDKMKKLFNKPSVNYARKG